MSFNLDSIDQTAKVNGVEQEYKGSKFIIASTSTHRFQEYFSSLQKPFKRQIDKGELSPEVSLDLLCKALARHVLLDWSDCTNGKGEDVPYSEERAYYALKNNDELRELVQEWSMDIGNYKAEKIEADSKN